MNARFSKGFHNEHYQMPSWSRLRLCKGTFHYSHCSMMFRRAKIWSIHPLPFLNPDCSCLSSLSIASSILFKRILQKILLGMDRRVIPRQLSQFWRSPFLGGLTISPLNQSVGMAFAVHNGGEEVCQKFGSQVDISFQHLRMYGINARCFAILHTFNGITNFVFSKWVCTNIKNIVCCSWVWWFFWMRPVEHFLEMLHPACSLLGSDVATVLVFGAE